MTGNVYEWCLDFYGEKYYNSTQTNEITNNPIGPRSGNSRVIRGGGWHTEKEQCYLFYRKKSST